jgi:hypothetical protein
MKPEGSVDGISRNHKFLKTQRPAEGSQDEKTTCVSKLSIGGRQGKRSPRVRQ